MFCEFCGNAVPAGASLCASCAAQPTTSQSQGAVAARMSAAGKDALAAVRAAMLDPVTGTGATYEVFGGPRALDAGIALALIADIAAVLALRIGARKSLGWFAPLVTGDSSVVALLKALIFAAVPIVALMLVLAIVRKIFNPKFELERAVFAGAVAVVPAALTLLVSAFLGAANFEIIAILTVFMMCYTTLLLFGACRDVLGLTSGKAAAAVAPIFIATAWVSKIVLVALT